MKEEEANRAKEKAEYDRLIKEYNDKMLQEEADKAEAERLAKEAERLAKEAERLAKEKEERDENDRQFVAKTKLINAIDKEINEVHSLKKVNFVITYGKCGVNDEYEIRKEFYYDLVKEFYYDLVPDMSSANYDSYNDLISFLGSQSVEKLRDTVSNFMPAYISDLKKEKSDLENQHATLLEEIQEKLTQIFENVHYLVENDDDFRGEAAGKINTATRLTIANKLYEWDVLDTQPIINSVGTKKAYDDLINEALRKMGTESLDAAYSEFETYYNETAQEHDELKLLIDGKTNKEKQDEEERLAKIKQDEDERLAKEKYDKEQADLPVEERQVSKDNGYVTFANEQEANAGIELWKKRADAEFLDLAPTPPKNKVLILSRHRTPPYIVQDQIPQDEVNPGKRARYFCIACNEATPKSDIGQHNKRTRHANAVTARNILFKDAEKAKTSTKKATKTKTAPKKTKTKSKSKTPAKTKEKHSTAPATDPAEEFGASGKKISGRGRDSITALRKAIAKIVA